jgi:1-acyl-sn-glycerol-3-phosphate acyltransferase
LRARGRAAGAAGRQVIIFPEGTRVAPGAEVALQPGIVAIARATGLPVVPVATDSGRYWARDAIRKRPGTIRIKLFPALPAGLDRAAMLEALHEAFYQRGVS